MSFQPEVRPPALWRELVRRRALLLALMLVGAVAGALVALGTPATYRATRVIVSMDPDAVPETFGRLSETVATTDTVLGPVVSRLGVGISTAELLDSGMLRVEPVTNAAVIRFVARSTDPTFTFDLARYSAESFVSVAEARGLGTFQVFGNDVLPTDADRRSVLGTLLLGMGLGGITLFLWVLLASFFRDPVVFDRDAASELGAAESFAIRISNAASPLRRERRWEVRPVGVLPALWRALQRAAGARDQGALLTCLLVGRRRSGDPWMLPLVDQLVGVARQIARRSVRSVAVHRWPSPDDGSLLGSLERSAAVLLLVSEGVPRARLKDLLEILPAGPRRIVALVAARGVGLPGPLRPKGTEETAEPRVEPGGAQAEAPERVQVEAHQPSADESDRLPAGNGRPSTPASIGPGPSASGSPAQLNDLSAEVRLEALSAVGADPSSEVIDSVIARFDDPDPRVREMSVAALARARSERAAGPLVEAVWSEDSVVRRRARSEIVRSAPPGAARLLIDELASKERFIQAAYLLTEMGSAGVAALSAALPAAEGVKRDAIRALLDSQDREGSRPQPGAD